MGNELAPGSNLNNIVYFSLDANASRPEDNWNKAEHIEDGSHGPKVRILKTSSDTGLFREGEQINLSWKVKLIRVDPYLDTAFYDKSPTPPISYELELEEINRLAQVILK